MSRTVVVVGGGYGGAAVAKALGSEPGADVVLIDPREDFVNAAGSLRAPARPDWAPNTFFPFETLLPKGTVIRDRAVSVDPGGKELLPAQRVLILGAGPVGLELAGELKEVWPDKHVTIVDPAKELLPGFRPEVVADLHRRLAAQGIEVRLDTALTEPPSTESGRAGTVTVTTTGGGTITADIWFRAYGTTVNSDYLADGKLTPRTPEGRVPVTGRLTVQDHEHVYAVGDLTDVPEAKMAGYAMQHAEVVAQDITAQLNGRPPTATYQPLGHPVILLPLGPNGGVGQLPSPEGPFAAPASTVAEFKGADLFTGRFTGQFGPTAAQGW
ncbi:FAD-dependent oxidoreductase [Streptomyces caatingaensis]|uniref:Pyridine nucleotide-disulfide oxidoreductase n=1 Tax=Streptomyces caatingaensis TaxID=1678637 RepID=A0A0K9XCR9_9ACTN|nr:FAD-dependent oxidoreductase [Streptomyces caatingaensis]KNB50452.1 pyridine nucleotide-disulfide oxidoreductase [Streptomyces caatingaensis]